MARMAGRKHGMKEEWIPCLLCRRIFRAITVSHLRRRHRWNSSQPVRDYKLRFGAKSSQSKATHRKRKVVQMDRCARLGTLWTRGRLASLLRVRRASGKPINRNAVRSALPAAIPAANRLYGDWDALLISLGFDPGRIRLRQQRTKAQLLREGREMLERGADMSPGSIHRTQPALEDAVLVRFGSWDAYLRALGEDPLDHRKRRRWNRDLVRRAILALPRIPPTRAIQRLDPALHAATGRYYGPWRTTVILLGRKYPM